MEDYSTPNFDSGYDGFDFGQAELNFTGQAYDQFSVSDTIPESWVPSEPEGLFPDTFPENWLTTTVPEEDQPGDLRFPEIWAEEVNPDITGPGAASDTFPERWNYGLSMSYEALEERVTEVDPYLVRAINEIGRMALRRRLILEDEPIELELDYDYRFRFDEDLKTTRPESGGWDELFNDMGYVLSDTTPAPTERRKGSRMTTSLEDDNLDPEVIRSYMELSWDETADCYLLTWQAVEHGPIPQDLVQAIKHQFDMAGDWAISNAGDSLFVYPLGKGRDDSEVLDLVGRAAEQVYSVPGEQIIATDIHYNL